MSHSKQNSERSPSSDRIKTNLFFDDFVDCIENLPSRLQLLLSELRNVDVLVKARHRKLHAIKLEIISKNLGTDNQDAQRVELDNLLHKMHQILIQCQTLGDQKVRLTSQIIELMGSKTRQLGYDPKTDEAKFHVDIDEEKILSEFRLTCKKNRPIHHHYNAANSSTNSRSSTRQIQNLTKAGHKQPIDLNKKVYNKKGLNSHRDLWHDDNSNHDHSLQNSINHLNGQIYVKKKPLNQRVNQSCASLADSKKSYKKLNDSKSSIDDSNQSSSTRSKRHINFCKTSNDLVKKSLNQSLKISRKRGLSISKKAHSSSSSTTSHQCKSPSSISSFSSLSSCKNKYLTNNTNNGNQSANTSSPKAENQTSNSDKAQKENMKINSKNKLVKRLGVRGRAKSKKSDKTSQENSEYESDDEKSAESDIHDSNGQKNSQIKNEAREDQLERNSNETESIKNLDEEENEPENEIEEDRPAPRSKRIKQEVDYTDDIRKKSTRIARNNLNETVTKISKSAHDEPIYCTCREISYGQMIMCDNDACQIEWFHFDCVKLTSKPKGRWYCPLCRGDTHKVMKKSHLIQSSASSNLSSPSYYASNYSNRLK